ncbi:serine/threonine-protein kinase [Dolichospermum heterosporum]|uniref:non-specific serine/threonine protein kinase n=1 Tax=Dolichospermum heterosporum TAC447 TaxID=747523 RepID=A0ABY5M302_9CYAN|nr:serine/threonine-protein kinase [Dolichospermum heterosporum]UUO17176.1 serine/threonine-protein kinase [Dolichospermum heterosporum TAC447]
MQSTITLTITTGKLSGKQYIFDSRTTCLIGRNDDCYLSIPDQFDQRVSRYHCLLDINPPEIRIRDLGSLNGTYINNTKIGGRQSHQNAEEAAKLNFPEYDLQHGDHITVGDTILKITTEIKQAVNQHPDIKTPRFITPEPKAKTKLFDVIQKLIKLAIGGERNLKALLNYQIIKSIGKGGFGEVYLAQHSQTGKFVALKVMLPAVAGDENHVQMFLREIENMKALKHPNVVELLDYGYAENLFFLVMEYYEGGNVYDAMQQFGGKLYIDMALGIILQVLDGLIYTHNAEIPYVKLANGSFGKGKGLVHRDLKPHNIFLCNINGKLTAKIGDYGLAKSFDLAGLSGQTFTKMIGGTPGFIPRQQVLKFKNSQPDVDVWASAACLYNMLTGYVPRKFTKDPFMDVLENDPVPILQRNGNIPKKLAQVIDLALIEKPQIHFDSAAKFKEALINI